MPRCSSTRAYVPATLAVLVVASCNVIFGIDDRPLHAPPGSGGSDGGGGTATGGGGHAGGAAGGSAGGLGGTGGGGDDGSWALRAGDGDAQQATRVAIAPDGHIAVAGNFEGVLNLAPITLTSAGGTDAFFAKLTGDGTPTWGFQVGDAGAGGGSGQLGHGVALDDAGGIIGAGDFFGTIDVPGGDLTATNQDVFVTWIPEGATVGSASQGAGASFDTLSSLERGPADVSYVVGNYRNDLSLGGIALPTDPEKQAFVAKLGSNGVADWATAITGGGEVNGYDIALAPAGWLAAVGYFKDSIVFNTTTLPSLGDYDAYVARLSSGGVVEWVRTFGDEHADRARTVAISDDRFVVAGTFKGDITFGSDQHDSAGDNDIFVVALDSAGTPLWSRRFGGPYVDNAWGVAIAPNGDIIVVGSAGSAFEFGGSALQHGGLHDAFVLRLAGDSGEDLDAALYGDEESQFAYDVAVDDDGSIVLVGSMAGSMAIGGTTLHSAGGLDAFVAKLAPGPLR